MNPLRRLADLTNLVTKERVHTSNPRTTLAGHLAVRWIPWANGYTAFLTGGMSIFITPEEDGWRVRFGLVVLSRLYGTAHEAKKAGIELARSILTLGSQDLQDLAEQT